MSETSSPFLKLTQIQGRGRSLVASQSIKAGQILLQDSPLLLYPSSLSSSSSFCSHCFRSLTLSPSSTHVSCPNCPNNLTIFCSPTCQCSSSHSPWLCNSLNKTTVLLSSSSLSPHLHTQALFLLFAFNLASLSPPRFRLLLSLEGEPSQGQDPAENLALHSFISSLPISSFDFSPDLTAALLAKDERNAFGLMEPFSGATSQRSVRAYAIYATASFFNHDCLPNACRFDYIDSVGGNNTDIVVRAIHDIEQGREVCLSYFPVNSSYADRQRRLLEDYGFLCDCDRCQVEKNWRNDDHDDNDEKGGEEEDGNIDKDQMEEEEKEDRDDDADDDDGDFPHAYFFVRYMCQRDNCGGTLAPLPPRDGVVSNILECNFCRQLTKEEDQLEVEDDEDEDMLNGE